MIQEELLWVSDSSVRVRERESQGRRGRVCEWMRYMCCVCVCEFSGKLTKDQIRSGYAALKKIDECISQNQFGDQLVQACDQFYTRIPHDFG